MPHAPACSRSWSCGTAILFGAAQLLGALAILEAWAGNLRLSHQHADDVLRGASASGLRNHPALADAYIAAAAVRRERGDVDRAKLLLDTADAVVAGLRRPTTAAIRTVELARWCLATRTPEVGLRAIEGLRLSGEPPPPAFIQRRLLATEAKLLLAAGRLDRARAAARLRRLTRCA